MGRVASSRRLRLRRRRSGETDYRRRLKLLRGGEARAVVRVSNTQVSCQVVNYQPDGDHVVASVNGKTLVSAYGWPSDASRKAVPAAYLAGYALGHRALAAGLDEAVLDIGLAQATVGARVFAALKGMVDAGLEVPHGEHVLPDASRLEGAHISDELSAAVAATKKAIEEAYA